MLSPMELIASPRVVATVHRPEDLDAIVSGSISPATADLLEFRLDSLRAHLDDVEPAMKASPLPYLVTARHPGEGGDGDLDSDTRASLLDRFLPGASFVDIEIRSLGALSQVAARAHAEGVGVVASAHDFGAPLKSEKRSSLLEQASSAPYSVVKMAMALPDLDSLTELVSFTEEQAAKGTTVATMGMGPLGKLSRLVLAAAGSRLNYGYLVEPNAPGQWPATELKRLLGEILP